MTDEDLIGKRLLAGITYIDAAGEVVRQVQTHGIITRTGPTSLAIRRLDEEGLFGLPPDTSNIVPASPGEYYLRSTGEVVVDPDFVSSWTVYQKDGKSN